MQLGAEIPDPLSCMNGYKLTTSFVQSGRCNKKELPALMDNLVCELKEHIYGDVRSIERRLARAFYERDEKAMASAIRDLHTELY